MISVHNFLCRMQLKFINFSWKANNVFIYLFLYMVLEALVMRPPIYDAQLPFTTQFKTSWINEVNVQELMLDDQNEARSNSVNEFEVFGKCTSTAIFKGSSFYY